MKNKKKRCCPQCGRELLFDDVSCPYCGVPLGMSFAGSSGISWGKVARWIGGVAAAIVFLSIAAYAVTEVGQFVQARKARSQEIQMLVAEPTVELVYPDTSEELEKLEIDAVWREPETVIAQHEELTEQQKDAVQYLCDSYFPEGYSLEKCVYYMNMNGITREDTLKAIECCQVDFKVQALRKALYLLGRSDYGPVKLTEELEDAEFTREEADYAVENCGADWEYETELAVKSYLYYISISQESLERILVDSGHDSDVIHKVLEKLQPDWNREALQRAAAAWEDRTMSREELYDYMKIWDYTDQQCQYAVDMLIPE